MIRGPDHSRAVDLFGILMAFNTTLLENLVPEKSDPNGSGRRPREMMSMKVKIAAPSEYNELL